MECRGGPCVRPQGTKCPAGNHPASVGADMRICPRCVRSSPAMRPPPVRNDRFPHSNSVLLLSDRVGEAPLAGMLISSTLIFSPPLFPPFSTPSPSLFKDGLWAPIHTHIIWLARSYALGARELSFWRPKAMLWTARSYALCKTLINNVLQRS